jgi:hypothetical protein
VQIAAGLVDLDCASSHENELHGSGEASDVRVGFWSDRREPELDVDRDGAIGTGQHRFEVELGHFEYLVGHPSDPQEQVLTAAVSAGSLPRYPVSSGASCSDCHMRWASNVVIGRSRKARSPSRSVCTPPRPSTTSVAELPVVDNAGDQFDAGRRHPLDDDVGCVFTPCAVAMYPRGPRAGR